MSGEWQGWQSWAKYKEAGIVESAVDFSEEAIIVDHAVGRTKDAIGKCWPMDAAVAYTLMKGGPDASLTWKQMVNTHTRAAAVMMSGKVGYGLVPTPDTPSCGHDEIEGYIVELGEPKMTGSGLYLASSYGYKTLGSWLDDLEPLHFESHDLDAIKKKYTHIRMNVNQDIRMHSLVTDEWFAELLALLVDAFNRGDDEFETPKELAPLKIYQDGSMIKSRSKTYGECKWAGTGKECLHHDRPTTRMWSMIRKDGKDTGMSGYHFAWHRYPCAGGDNYDQWIRCVSVVPKAKNVVAWDTMRRGMAQAIPEDTVIGYIRESLTRMLKRNDNIVSKDGRGKNSTHRWSDWGWLAEMAAYVKNTSSKNRKAGDIENGWKYCKTRARKSFGHEIADFVWRPIEQIKDYVVGRQEPTDYYTSGVMQNLRFPTKEACKNFMETIAAAHIDAGGHYASRKHDGLEKNEKGQWSIRSIEVNIVMRGTVDPDDYLSPQEVISMWRHASPTVLKEHKVNFEITPRYTIEQTPSTTEGANDD